MDAESKAFDEMMEAAGKLPPPVLPEMRMFVVRRYDPKAESDVVEEVYVTAHCIQYSGFVLMFQTYSFDEQIQRPIERTVRAFNSWIDVEVVPTPVKTHFAH